MPKKASGVFNQNDYIKKWAKENMKSLNLRYKKELVEEFRNACEKLGVKQSEVVRNAMLETIEKAKE